MKGAYRKFEPRIVHYHDFKYFFNNNFKESISQNLGDGCDEIGVRKIKSFIKTKELICQKSKREYYQNLSVENVSDNKTFWKVLKPFLSNKIMSSEKIALAEGTKSLRNDKETAKVLNNFFSTIIQNLKIPQYRE